MRILSVYGSTKTGKTTTAEAIIKELRKRGRSVGSIKEIHFEQFQIDPPGTNTSRHRHAGSQLVTARGLHETDVLYSEKLPLSSILRHYSHDFVICEGVEDANIAKILTGANLSDLDQRWSPCVIAVSGVVSADLHSYNSVPVINALTDIDRMVNLIEEKALPLLPDVDAECCFACGMDCRTFCDSVLKGKSQLSDCVQQHQTVDVFINGQPLDLVPFVQDIIRATATGMISQLRGYQNQADIRIEIRNRHDIS